MHFKVEASLLDIEEAATLLEDVAAMMRDHVANAREHNAPSAASLSPDWVDCKTSKITNAIRLARRGYGTIRRLPACQR